MGDLLIACLCNRLILRLLILRLLVLRLVLRLLILRLRLVLWLILRLILRLGNLLIIRYGISPVVCPVIDGYSLRTYRDSGRRMSKPVGNHKYPERTEDHCERTDNISGPVEDLTGSN